MASQPQVIHLGSPSTWSIPTYSTMLHKQSKANMDHMRIGMPMVDLKLAGSDVRILSKTFRECTVTGIDHYQINGLDIVLCAAMLNMIDGYVKLILTVYAYYGKGYTIHSSGQIDWHKNLDDEESAKLCQISKLSS